MSRKLQIKLLVWMLASLAVGLMPYPPYSMAWTIPGHMLGGEITYQILRRDSPSRVATVSAILKKHPWYENQWWGQLENLSEAEREQMLFMLAARWPDDIRT